MNIETYLLVVAGILISIIYPILRKALPKSKLGIDRQLSLPARIWDAAKPYIVGLIFACITAPLVIAFLGDRLENWSAALLAGFAWEATIEKVKEG